MTDQETPDAGVASVDQGEQPQQSNPPPEATDDGFAAITSQDEFDRRLKSRLSKFRDYDSLKGKASQLDALVAASQTDLERAREEAKLEAAKETSAAFVPRLVKAEFRAAAKGVLTAAQLSALMEDLDLSKYATEDGEADAARISKKVAAVAPPADERSTFPDLGAGQRGGTAKTTDMNDVIRRAAGLSG